jgi:hypothetical protein
MKGQQVIKRLIAGKKAALSKPRIGCVPCFGRVNCVPCLGRADSISGPQATTSARAKN